MTRETVPNSSGQAFETRRPALLTRLARERYFREIDRDSVRQRLDSTSLELLRALQIGEQCQSELQATQVLLRALQTERDHLEGRLGQSAQELKESRQHQMRLSCSVQDLQRQMIELECQAQLDQQALLASRERLDQLLDTQDSLLEVLEAERQERRVLLETLELERQRSAALEASLQLHRPS